MPTYDYVCDGCSHEFEEWQTLKAEKLITCPKCSKNKLRRLFGCPFVFCKAEPKTLGELAEANTKKFGKEECQERELRAKEAYEKAKGKTYKQKKDAKIPWWRSGSVSGLEESDKVLSDKQVTKYKKDMEEMGNRVVEKAKPPKALKEKKKNARK